MQTFYITKKKKYSSFYQLFTVYILFLIVHTKNHIKLKYNKNKMEENTSQEPSGVILNLREPIIFLVLLVFLGQITFS